MARDYLNELMQKRSAILGTPSSNKTTTTEFDPAKNRDNYIQRMEGSGIDSTVHTDKRNFIEKGLNLPENQNVFFDALEILGRPQQALFGAIDDMMWGGNPLEGAWKGLTGEKDTSGGQLIRNLGIGSEDTIGLDDFLGFGLDVMLDPADLALFGAGKVAKAGKAMGAVSDGGKILNATDNLIDTTKAVENIVDGVSASSKIASMSDNLVKGTLDVTGDTLKATDTVVTTAKSGEKATKEARKSLNYLEGKEILDKYVKQTAEKTADETPVKLIDKIKKNFAINKDKYSFTDMYFNAISGTAKTGINVADDLLGHIFTVLDKSNVEKGLKSNWSDLYKNAKLTGTTNFNHLKALPKEIFDAVNGQLSMFKTYHEKAARTTFSIGEEVKTFAKQVGLPEKDIHVVLQRELEKDVSRSMALEDITPLLNKADDFDQNISSFRWTPENEKVIKNAYGIGMYNEVKERVLEPSDIYDVFTSSDGEKFIMFNKDAGDFLLREQAKTVLTFDRVDYGAYNELYQRVSSAQGYAQLLDSVKKKTDLTNAIISSYIGIDPTKGYVHRAITKEAMDAIQSKAKVFTDEMQGDFQGLVGKTKQFADRKYAGDALEANAQAKAVYESFIAKNTKDMAPEEVAEYVKKYQPYKMFEEDLFSSMADYVTKYPDNIRNMRTVVDVLSASMFKDMKAFEELEGARKAITKRKLKIKQMFDYFGDEITGELKSADEINAIYNTAKETLQSKKDELAGILSKHDDELKGIGEKLKEAQELEKGIRAKLETTKNKRSIASLQKKLDDAQLRVSGFEKQIDDAMARHSDEVYPFNEELKNLTTKQKDLDKIMQFREENRDVLMVTREELEKVSLEQQAVKDQIDALRENTMITEVSQTYKPNILREKVYSGEDFKKRLEAINETINSDEIKKIISDIDTKKNYTIDNRIARYIEVDHKPQASLLLKMFDKYTSFFKSTKLLNPAFNIRNTLGIYTNLYLSGMNNADIGKYMVEAQKIFSKQDEVFEKFIKMDADLQAIGKLKDGVANLDPQWLAKYGISDEDLKIYQTITKFSEAGFNRADPVSAMSRNFNRGVGSAVGADFKESFATSVNKINELADKYRIAQASGDALAIDLAKDALDKANYVVNKGIMYNMYANEYMDSLGRMAVMLKGIDDPDFIRNLGVPDVASAIRTVMFDPYELSDFERKVMRRVIPFYTFAKKNLAYQMGNISKNGVQYNRMYKALKSGYDMAGIDTEELQDFKLNQFYIPVPLGNDGRYGVIKANLPISELGEWMSDPMTKVLSSLNPLIKAPVEISTNKNLFTGGEISEFKGQDGYKIDSFLGLAPIDRYGEYAIGMTGLDAPINALGSMYDFTQGDEKSVGNFADALGIYREYDIESDRKAKAYEQLKSLEDAVQYYKQEEVDIYTLKELEAKANNPSLENLKNKFKLMK